MKYCPSKKRALEGKIEDFDEDIDTFTLKHYVLGVQKIVRSKFHVTLFHILEYQKCELSMTIN